jgi:hypothetical protein
MLWAAEGTRMPYPLPCPNPRHYLHQNAIPGGAFSKANSVANLSHSHLLSQLHDLHSLGWG